MASRNSRKEYVKNGYYHIYNRGVNKQPIFLDLQDYNVFVSYLRDYLTPKDIDALQKELSETTSWKRKDEIRKELRRNNFANEIQTIAYCLMPNHIHLLVKQKSSGSIDKFMNSLGTRYTKYFNLRYKRLGPLYQDVYKAVLITSDEQLLHLTRYIHKQAMSSQPSSYTEYLRPSKSWVHSQEILSYFSSTIPSLSYSAFVSQPEEGSTILDKIILEDTYYEE